MTATAPAAPTAPTAPPSTATTARAWADATPASRDRVVDFLRVASIAVVVFGHWLMAVFTVRDGRFHATNTLVAVPWLRRATWVLQVMPIFFFVGGFSSSVAIDAYRRRGLGACEFVRDRVRRLLRPVFVLLGAWVPVAIALGALGLRASVLGPATKLVVQPLWFVAVYVCVTALAPAMRRLHDRAAGTTLAALACTAGVVDVARFATGVDTIGAMNLACVWLFAQQLGFFYADGTLLAWTRARVHAMAAAGFGALVLLTGVAGYPVSMVGLPGERISNMDPPTVCLLALTVLQVAGVLLVRPALARWLADARRWRAVVAANGVVMTVFLWHLTALLLVLVGAHALGVALPTPPAAVWWITRPLWLAGLCVLLAALVSVFGRWERPRAPRPVRSRLRATGTALAVAGIAVGIAGIAASDLSALRAPGRAHVIVLSLSTLQSLVVLLLAAAVFAPHAAER